MDPTTLKRLGELRLEELRDIADHQRALADLRRTALTGDIGAAGRMKAWLLRVHDVAGRLSRLPRRLLRRTEREPVSVRLVRATPPARSECPE